MLIMEKQSIKCGICGTTLSSSDQFCLNCGTKITIKKTFKGFESFNYIKTYLFSFIFAIVYTLIFPFLLNVVVLFLFESGILFGNDTYLSFPGITPILLLTLPPLVLILLLIIIVKKFNIIYEEEKKLKFFLKNYLVIGLGVTIY